MENQKKSNVKLIVLIAIVAFIVLVAIGIVVFNIVNSGIQKQILFGQIDEINSSTTVDMEIKTKGEYAKVEKALKEHLKEYYATLDNITNTYQDTGLENMLTAANISATGPEFKDQKAKLESITKAGEEAKTKIIDLASDEYKIKKAKTAELNEKYSSLYYQIVDLTENSEKNVKVISANNEYLNKLLEILNYLSDNKNNWKVNDQMIEFTTTELANKYNELLNEAKVLAAKIVTISQ
ncbi:MAG: DUF3053 family protein [Clostridia bacterium]|nr:DUF3053 family protein [Clostridia bacterium]